MNTPDPEQMLFYGLLISGAILLLIFLYGLFRFPPECKPKKDDKPKNPASQAS